LLDSPVWQDSPILVAALIACLVAFAIAWQFRSRAPGRGASIGIVLATATCNAFLYRTRAEDAFITYRYALNLADGHGAVFNIGERVEGYSDFLWMVTLAATHALTGLEIETIARGLGLLATLGTVYLTYRLALALTADTGLSLLAALLLSCSGPFAAYALSGLETPLFALLLVAVVYCLVQSRFIAGGVLLALAIMTRPDACALVPAILGWLIFAQSTTGASRRARLARFTVPLLAIVVPWTAWRVGYYGYAIPNALAAKLGGAGVADQVRDGARYVRGFSFSIVPLLLIAAFVIVVPLVRRRRLEFDQLTVLLGLLLGSMAAFVVVAGGDWMPAWRLLAPAVPLVVVVLAQLAHLNRAAWTFSARNALVATTVACVVLVSLSFTQSNMITRVRLWADQVDALAFEGDWLQRSLPGSTVAVYANGALSYNASSSITMIDMLGLTDEHIARDGKRLGSAPVGHRAYDDRYVRARRPDLIVFAGGGFSPTASCEVPKGYSQRYRGRSFRVDTTNPTGRFMNLFVRSDEADRLTATLDESDHVRLVKCPPGPDG
jgi:hypothetical protein